MLSKTPNIFCGYNEIRALSYKKIRRLFRRTSLLSWYSLAPRNTLFASLSGQTPDFRQIRTLAQTDMDTITMMKLAFYDTFKYWMISNYTNLLTHIYNTGGPLMCGLLIWDFRYFFWCLTFINSSAWCFYIRTSIMWDYFLSPYPTNITKELVSGLESN